MTDKLKTLLHEQATAPDFAPVDLGAITTTGERRVRRRRVSAVAAGLTAAVVVVAVAVSTGGAGDDGAIDPVGRYAEARPSWAAGTVIHYGETEIEVGRQVDAFTYTGTGFVLVSDHEVWSLDDEGSTQVGEIAQEVNGSLVLGDDGIVLWMEGAPGSARSVVAFDQRTGEARRFEGDEIASPVGATEGEAWFVTQDALRAGDLANGGTRILRNGLEDAMLLGVRHGVVARMDGRFRVTVGPLDGPSVALRSVAPGMILLSPSARWAAASGTVEAPNIYDVQTGEARGLDLPRRALGIATSWLDDTHVVVATLESEDEEGPVELHVCAVPDGTCDLRDEVPASLADEVVFAWGMTMGGDSVSTGSASSDPHVATASPIG